MDRKTFTHPKSEWNTNFNEVCSHWMIQNNFSWKLGIKWFKSEGIGIVLSFAFMCGVIDTASIKKFTMSPKYLKQGSSDILTDNAGT